LVNQWQIIACVKNGPTAALVAPFKPKDTALFAIISAFDAAYAAYNQFQNGMERYWTLKLLQQQQMTELEATVIKDGVVRADALPLVMNVLGADHLPRHARVKVRLGAIDEISLDVSGAVVERLDAEALPSDAEESGDDEVENLGGPLTITMDIDAQEPSTATAAASSSVSPPAIQG
jgi:exoribonuclease-2